MLTMRFFDDNTRSWWTPVTGGSNVPALNDLLEPFGAAFGDTIIQVRSTRPLDVDLTEHSNRALPDLRRISQFPDICNSD